MEQQKPLAPASLRNTRLGNIRWLWMLWVSSVVLSFVLLCGSLVGAISKLHAETRQIYFDSQSLATNRAFEVAITEEERSSWQRHLKGQAPDLRAQRWQQASQQLAIMRGQADSPGELKLVEDIAAQYKHLQSKGSAPANGDTFSVLEPLLQSIAQHRDLNTAQMNATLEASNHLDRVVDTWSIVLVLGAAGLALTGSAELWNRIFKPVLQLAVLSQRIGAGELTARAAVVREDEMGMLSSTFNTMAEALQNRERERLDFVATIAHDLRNPLVVIGGASLMLRDKPDKFSADERAHWLEIIGGQTKRLEALIDDMMEGVQAETGRLKLHISGVDFANMVREAVELQKATNQTHTLHFDGPQNCPIQGDPKRLDRVVSNLLSNAVKYSETGSEVHVKLREDGESAVLEVCDQGVGIAPDDLPKLFRPFSRIDRTRKMAKGTGLGLSSVKKIVEAHGGTITVCSKLGEGTTFEVTLPAQSQTTSPNPTETLVAVG